MSKHTRLITAILAIMFCLTFCSLTAFAEDFEGDQQPEIITDEPETPIDEPVDPGYEPIDPVVDPEPQTPVEDPSDYDYNDGNGGESGGYEEPDYDDNSGEVVYYDSDGNSYSDQSDVYVGGGQSYDPPLSTAPSAALFDTDNRIDVSSLSNRDWNDIAARLKNADNTADDDGSGDFAFIQQNTSRSDNGHWIIIAGILCLLLSLTGFVYVIASGVHRRKQIKAGNITKSSGAGSHTRATNDYDDGFRQSKKSNGGKRYK